ncbi:MAG TPA: 2-oxoacid:ferredoxin oxidoreductase subunit beta [Gemmatimonadaceae bacterium]|nr:2-oxoacid:ferredoxin oxidoreductase subunit beta [Gemmatimonadaceae bacterium]
MSYSIVKPGVRHPSLQPNRIGLTRRDYEGTMSTLCAGCGHDSITAAIVQAFWELEIEPHRVAKLSGIGCSSKTPAYFLKEAHGFNAVHGRMPSVATGANAANRDLLYIGISGDGDSLSIGLGQLCHAIRRNVNLLYVLENNGVYGLTKGQFSASADVGSKSKKGEANTQRPIDPVLLGLTLGATFVARSFSGDKAHLVPIIKAGLAHQGFALVDVISPCVTFNDHTGSTKSYRFTREHVQDVAPVDYVPIRREISVARDEGRGTRDEGNGTGGPNGAAGDAGSAFAVTMHDGSVVRFRKTPEEYDPTDRDAAYAHVRALQNKGEVAMGLLFIDRDVPDMHEQNGTASRALAALPYETLCPGNAALEALQKEYR